VFAGWAPSVVGNPGGFFIMTRDLAFARLQAPILLLARVLLSYLFIVEGVGKIGAFGEVSDYMRQHGVDPRLLPLVIATELGGGLLILLGFAARPAAVALAGFCLLTALLFHGSGDAEQTIQFQKNLAIAGGFLTLVIQGPGAWSLEALWRRRAALGAHKSQTS
jgi:putative oxidoreductase